jgi:Holliday junction resolvase RusA-like endonuclease
MRLPSDFGEDVRKSMLPAQKPSQSCGDMMRHPSHSHRQAVLEQAERGLASFTDPPFACPTELVLHLPRCPSVNELFPTVGKRRIQSAEYKAWIKHAGYLLNLQRPTPIKGKVEILIELEEPTGLADCANYEKATTDLLVKHKIIQGDDRRYVRRNTQAWADVDGCRVTIRSAE